MPKSAILIFLLAWCAMGAEEPRDILPVLFTGRLMGYFRIPDRQLSAKFQCEEGPDAAKSPQVKALLGKFRRMAGGKPRLLLGLGDNFSPDLWSRFVYLANGPEPKDTLLVESDNVACFLGIAGYDAMVPGKHDFYFGPERLREYARQLAEGPAHTAMLGANLAIVTTSVVPARKAPASANPLRLDLPDLVFPWMQNFIVQGAYRLKELTTTGEAGAGKPLSDFSPQAVITKVDVVNHRLTILDHRVYGDFAIQWMLEKPGVAALGGGEPDARILVMNEEGLRDRHPDGSAIASHPAPSGGRPAMLPPGRYRFQATAPGANIPSYQDFSVQRPFFEGEPYLMKEVGGETAAIFGVVEGGLKEHVGLLNYSWQNTNPDLDTQLTVADPVLALDQALQYCRAQPNCLGARKILLAQMPYEEAQLMAGTFRFARTAEHTRAQVFELVLAQTDERHAAVDQTRSQDAVAPFVLSPGQVFQENDRNELHVRVYRAELGHHRDERRPRLDLTLTSDLQIVPLDTKTGNTLSRQTLHTVALEAMRARRNTDLALLQKRDLFELPDLARRGPLTLQEQMDTVFWKGDFLVQVDVTGAQLKSVMDQSRQFDRMDANLLDSGLERGRGLVALGIWPDGDGNWKVNGATLDANRLYSVATTDFLAFGDTGYTGLRPAYLPRIGDVELVRLSSLVCHRMDAADPSCRKIVLPGGNYFDETDATVFEQREPAAMFDDLIKWTHVTAAQKPPAGEDAAQNHKFWSATLERASFGYSFYHHMPASQAQLKSQFGGIPQSQVLTANSIAISNDFRLRIVRSARRWDRYILAEESYEHDVKQANDDTRVDSQASNMLGFEAGLNLRILPNGRRLPAVKLLASIRTETNPAQPLASFSLKPGGTLVRPIDRQFRIPAKVGTRIENKVSWLEFGYQISKNLHSPVGYEFLDHGTRAILATCGATSALQKNALSACISNASDPAKTTAPITLASDVIAVTQTRWQHGIFLNFKLQVPLLRKDPCALQYIMENTGNLYFHYFNQPDYSLDTRWLDTWTHSLAVKLVGNVSLAPKLQYLFYENMVDHLRMHSLATSVSLQYSFGWHSGLGLRDALTYADPTIKSSK